VRPLCLRPRLLIWAIVLFVLSVLRTPRLEDMEDRGDEEDREDIEDGRRKGELQEGVLFLTKVPFPRKFFMIS
jgi:hypothetical protein